MTAKSYLEQVQRAEKELLMIQERREHYLALGGALGANISGVPGSHDKRSRVEMAGVAMADLATRMDEKAARYKALVDEAQGLVDKLEVQNFRLVLEYYYFMGKSMKEISEIMGYEDDKSIYRVRSYALKEFEKLMPT